VPYSVKLSHRKNVYMNPINICNCFILLAAQSLFCVGCECVCMSSMCVLKVFVYVGKVFVESGETHTMCVSVCGCKKGVCGLVHIECV
jgi:hypothetical protein